MGTRTRRQSNQNVVGSMQDGNIKVIRSSSGTSPQVRITRRASNPMEPTVNPLADNREAVLAVLPMANKIRQFGEYLQREDESFYLQPRLFHRYLNTFFEDSISSAPERLVETEVVDGRQESGMYRITLGRSDSTEYLLALKRIDNSGAQSFDLKFYKRGESRERLITESSILFQEAKSTKIEDPDDKLMFKGFLKLLEVEEGKIPPSYYRVLTAPKEA